MQNIKPSWTKLKETLQKSFTSYIPNQIFLDDRLHNSSKTVYGIINALCFNTKDNQMKDFCYPSIALISYLSGLSSRTVGRCIKELERLQYLKIKRTLGYVNVYQVVHRMAQKVVNTIKNKTKLIKEKNKNKKKKQNNFNNFNQRSYDYDDLERKLLGWERTLDLDGSEYLQATLT